MTDPTFYIAGPGRCGSMLLAQALVHQGASMVYANAADFVAMFLGLPVTTGQFNGTHDPAARHRGVQLAPLELWREDPRPTVLLIRDPRDVYCSWLAYAKRRDLRRWVRRMQLDAPDAETFARFWCRVCDDPPPWCKVTRYDNLVRALEPELRAVCAFLGMAFDPAALQPRQLGWLFAAQTKHGTSLSAHASIDRWRHELDPTDAATIARVCAQGFERYCFPRA